MLGMERAQHVIAAGDDRRRAALGKLLGKELFVTLQQGCRGVDDQHALTLGKAQQMHRVDEFGIHRRVFPHQHYVQFGQRALSRLA